MKNAVPDIPGRDRVGQVLVISAFLVVFLFRGGTDPGLVLLATILLCLACILGCSSYADNRRVNISRAKAFWIALALAAYILFQTWQSDYNPFATSMAHRLFDAEIGLHSISVAPQLTKATVFPAILPFLFYIASLSLFHHRGRPEALVKLLAFAGGFFAVFGMLQLMFFPNSMIFSDKTRYLESLTGTFVNRNTAGTLLSVASLAALASLIMVKQEVPGAPLRDVFNPDYPRMKRLSIMLFASIFLICIQGLFLTRSRGALLAASVGFLVVVPLLLARVKRSPNPSQPGPARYHRWAKLGFMALGILTVLIVITMFAGQTLHRMQQQSVDVGRLCLYTATIDAYLDNWVFGTGFGTFETVFPLYRQETCGALGSTFLRAHNSYLEGLMGLGLIFIPFTIAVTLHLLANLKFGFENRYRKRFFAIIGLGGMSVAYSHSLVDFSLQIPGMSSFFALFMGAISLICLEKEKLPRSNKRTDV